MLSQICTYNESKLSLQLFNAGTADALLLEYHDLLGAFAKDAGGLVLLQNDASVFREDLKRALDLNAHLLTELRGQNKSAKLIHFSDNSR